MEKIKEMWICCRCNIQKWNTEIKWQMGKAALDQYNFKEFLKIIWEGSEEDK